MGHARLPRAVKLLHQASSSDRAGAGTQFDPSVIDAIANLIIGLAWPPERSNANETSIDPVGSTSPQ
jgi:hypothetical protein